MSEAHPLEELFKKAADDPDARASFYEALMNSAVYVVGRPEEETEEGQSAPHVQIKQWRQPDGNMALPFFASEEALRRTLPEETEVMPIGVVDLFRLSGGTTLVFTADGRAKPFLPDEIEALLASTMALDPLALALLKTARENTEANRVAFYSTLVNAQIFLLGRPKDETRNPSAEKKLINQEDQFYFHAIDHPHLKGQKVLPFFSSLEHLKRFVRTEETYLSFPAMAFFNMALGLDTPLVLNPGYEPHKFFSREEIESILQAARPEPFEPRHFKAGSKVVLGPPETYPQELVGALLDFLPEHREVKAAYLTMMKEEETDGEPVLVIGFEAEGDLSRMFREAAPLVNEYATEGMAIDFAKVARGEGGLSQYFLDKVRPFYLRPTQRNNSKNAAPGSEKAGQDSPVEKYDKPGFFGRFKRIFGSSKKNED